MARCGLGKINLNDTFDVKVPFGTDLEGRFLLLEDGGRSWLLATFDYSFLFRSSCLEWRKGISEATGIPASNIWVHTSQTHSAPEGHELDDRPCRKLIELSIPIIRKVISESWESELSYGIADLGSGFNFNREVYVPELGAVTAWGGRLNTDQPGYPYTQDPDALLLCGYRPEIPAFSKPIYFDRPVDPLAALMVFRAKSGEVLGALVRYSGHPDIAASGAGLGLRPEQFRYHFDWPGYVRRIVESEIGGIGVCVNGPCGNVGMKYTAPNTYEEADRLARRIGEGIASAVLASWKEEKTKWESIHIGSILNDTADLPLRDLFPARRADLITEEALRRRGETLFKELELLQGAHARPTQIKQMVDEIQFTSCIRSMVEKWTNLSDAELAKRVMQVDLEAIRINDLVLAGFPGETMTETSMMVQAQSIGRKLITFDQVNGYHAYMTSDNAHNEGGYSYWGGLVARGSEGILRRKALDIILQACRMSGGLT
ncbi:MAG: hypothetical protein WC975_10240 [Phycisphaerae bacterium]